MNEEQIIMWVHQFAPWMSDSEALQAYKVYRDYLDEGQSSLVSRQYAGLL